MTQELWMLVGLFSLVLLGMGYLIRESSNANSRIQIEDLFLERGPDGKKQLSKIAVYLFGAFAISTWVIVVKVVNATLSETEFLGYLGIWVTPLLAKIVKNGHAPEPPK
jgi:hypothetical protein